MKRWLENTVIRKKWKQTCNNAIENYTVRIARTEQEYEEAFQLVQISYILEGIESINKAGRMRIQPQHMLHESIVLVAYDKKDQLVGTMTLFVDSPAGLPLDKDFPDELNQLRDQGAKLVEYGSLSIVRKCWRTGVNNLLEIAAQNCRTRWLQSSHVVVGVNPRAEKHYSSLYDFRRLTKTRNHASLDAPVIGLVKSDDHFIPFAAKSKHFNSVAADGSTFHEWYFGNPPPCICLPQKMSREELTHWKLRQKTFYSLFIAKQNRVDSLELEIIEKQLSNQRPSWMMEQTMPIAIPPRPVALKPKKTQAAKNRFIGKISTASHIN